MPPPATAPARCLLTPLVALLIPLVPPRDAAAAELVGVGVVPHVQAEAMRYRRPRPEASAARVQLFIRGHAADPRFAGRTPAELVAEGAWAWQGIDAGLSASGPADHDGEEPLHVWEFNGRSAAWGVGSAFPITADGLAPTTVEIAPPPTHLAAVTFLAGNPWEDRDRAPTSALPDRIVVHVANGLATPLSVESIRLWLPTEGRSWNRLFPSAPIAVDVRIPAGEKGVVTAVTAPLPPAPAALEVRTSAGTLWTACRVKAERFDIGGGWIGDHLREEPYRRLLGRLHVTMGQIGMVPGYTDDEAAYARHPLRLCNKPNPIGQFDDDRWLPRIHAVEFLGEPQYGGGRPVPPQEVFDAFLPYRASRLPTSVTHSEERIWAHYAGLSDFPHYDAYRVVAPAADDWRQYERFADTPIRWGAPLETIGDLCRNLRDLNRPMPCAVWSQGPHDGWKGWLDGRPRRSPTPDELRAQAVHALATRVTSLYWFNLSKASLERFPDTHEAITRVGREIRMLEPLFLEGDATSFVRRAGADGRPDWELSVVAAPTAAVLFAVDTAYRVDADERVFAFDPPRPTEFSFDLPERLRRPVDLFRIDADGVHETEWSPTPAGVRIRDVASRDRIYVATIDDGDRGATVRRHREALAHERANADPPE